MLSVILIKITFILVLVNILSIIIGSNVWGVMQAPKWFDKTIQIISVTALVIGCTGLGLEVWGY